MRPNGLSPLSPPWLSACLQLFALPLVDGVSAVADYALHQCERMFVSVTVCACVCVCECFYAMLIYFNSYLMSNVKAHARPRAKKKALKTVAYICAMASARALPTIRNVHAFRFCGTCIGNNNCGHMNHSSK